MRSHSWFFAASTPTVLSSASPLRRSSRKNNAKPCKYQLTAREMEILELTAKGLKTPQLAAQLFISATTVRNHLKNIFSKLGVHSRAEAVGLALRSNFF